MTFTNTISAGENWQWDILRAEAKWPVKKQVNEQVENQVYDQVHDQVLYQLWNLIIQIRFKIHHEIRK